MKLKFAGALALGMLFTSCGPYGVHYWLITVNQANNDPSRWPASCFPQEPGASTTQRMNDARSYDLFRDPFRWETYQVKGNQHILQVDAATAGFIAGIISRAWSYGADNNIAAADIQVIEGTDGKGFTATYTDLNNAGGMDAPQFNYTATVNINWVNQDPATSGTITVTANRTCTGGAAGACLTAPDLQCQIPAFDFLARRLEDVQNTPGNTYGDN